MPAKNSSILKKELYLSAYYRKGSIVIQSFLQIMLQRGGPALWHVWLKMKLHIHWYGRYDYFVPGQNTLDAAARAARGNWFSGSLITALQVLDRSSPGP